MSKITKSVDELRAQLKDLLPVLRAQYQLQSLAIFGSFVRGDEREESDLDLLVTFNEIPSLFRFVALENFLSDELHVKVDLVMKDSLKPAIGEYILREAQPV